MRDLPSQRGIVLLLTALAFSQLILLPRAETAERFLDSVDVRTSFGSPEVVIRFTEPVQYVNHTPHRVGEELQVQLRPASPQSSGLARPGDEHLSWTATPKVPLAGVSYEGNGLGGRLTIRFDRPVSFLIRPGADLRTLIIGLKSSNSARIERPTIPIEPVTPAEPRIAGEYAINLESSLEPIDTSGFYSLPLFKKYFPYTTRFKLDGKVWHRLRIGYFDTGAEAESVMATVKDHFPDAWVAKVSPDAKERLAQGSAVPVAVSEQPNARREPAAAEDDSDHFANRASIVRDGPAVVELGPTEIRPNVDVEPGVSFESDDANPLTPQEIQALLESLKAAAAEGEQLATVPECDEKLLALMEQARQAMAGKDYSTAIGLYTKVLRTPNTPCAQDAQEFLALARERNGQKAHAKAEYDRYLAQYPEGEGATRVKQRVAALTTQRQTPKQKRRAARGTDPYWDVYGGVSQFYRRNETQFDITEQPGQNLVTLSGVFSDVDVTARRRSQNHDIRARVTGGHIKDFLEEGPGDRTQLTSAYIEATDLRRDMSVRVGRQTSSSGGVLGRFDGGLFGYRLKPNLKLNAVAGYPVSFSDNSVNTNRHFYGVNFELGTYADAWDFIPFIIEQQVDGILDRRAVGWETRYFDANKTFLSVIDYDLSYKKLNNLLLLGNWTFPNRLTFNVNVDYRNAPVLTTNNALIGQTSASIEELLLMLDENQVRQLALDHTPTSEAVTVGLSRPITEKLQLSADITMMELSDFIVTDVEMIDPLNPPSPFEEQLGIIPASGKQYFYNLQFIGSSLIKQGDIGILGLRYSDTVNSSTSTVTLNSRFPINQAWRINPRLRVDYRENKMDGGSQFLTLPSVRVDYRARRNLRFELEAGWEVMTRELLDGLEENRSGYFVNLGYRWNY